MIIHAFLRWAETAKASDRAKAAGALARAYASASIGHDERNAAEMAMMFLLDDPAPRVRQALAEALADFPSAPRAVILPLAADQPEVSGPVLMRSDVLTDADLVDLAARGSDATRSFIAHRAFLSRAVSAALAEVGSVFDLVTMLASEEAVLSRRTLMRICERHGDDPGVRARLLGRDDLPSEARHALVEKVGSALACSSLVRATVGSRRAERIAREACDVATIGMAAEVEGEEVGQLVEHLRVCGRLTPVFLMQTLCAGRLEFVSAAMANLSGQGERRVRSILADGRQNAVRSLFEAAGLGRDVSGLFAEAILLWREDVRRGAARTTVAARLAARARETASDASRELLDMIESLSLAEQRRSARSFALEAARDAA